MLSDGFWFRAAGVVALVLTGAACGGGTEAFRPPPAESYPPEVVADGNEIYSRHCVVCHGGDGSGRVGPNIRQVWERMTPDEQASLIAEGRRAMPAFSRTLSDDEILAVVAYTRVGWPTEP